MLINLNPFNRNQKNEETQKIEKVDKISGGNNNNNNKLSFNTPQLNDKTKKNEGNDNQPTQQKINWNWNKQKG